MTLPLWALVLFTETINAVALVAAVLEYKYANEQLRALKITGRNGRDRIATLSRKRRNLLRGIGHGIIAAAAVALLVDQFVEAIKLNHAQMTAYAFILVALTMGFNTLLDRRERIAVYNFGSEPSVASKLDTIMETTADTQTKVTEMHDRIDGGEAH